MGTSSDSGGTSARTRALMATTDAARLLRDPLVNKGTAYTVEERERLGLEGLLPPAVESIGQQALRVLDGMRQSASALDKYRCLSRLQAGNETLYFRVVLDHLEEMLPLVYTPTVGEACVQWSRIHETPRGLYLSARCRGRIAGILRRWPRRDVGIIVVTDGGRILGLGDLGANGMGIPIGKLALYTACAGIPPERCLPVTIDVGTDSETVRADPFYLGDRRARMRGEEYDALLEEFVEAVRTEFPGAVLQFEDFNNATAFRLLQRYRDRLCCFNDDIQGTGAMGLAGILSAGRITGIRLADQRILFAGAGEACLGIGASVTAAMGREGLSRQEAGQCCLFLDSCGLVTAGRRDLPAHKRPFARDCAPVAGLVGAIEAFRPTALIGASGQGGLFTQPVLEAMSRFNARPIVFALSNPTSKAECTAAQACQWTGGRVIFASGSPFNGVEIAGRLVEPAQANNSHVFPGVGLGLLLAGARIATDDIFLAAAHALSREVSSSDLRAGRIFPAVRRMREVAVEVAVAVATVAHEQGLATRPRPQDMRAAVKAAMYDPGYA